MNPNPHVELVDRVIARLKTWPDEADLDNLYKVAKFVFGPDDSDALLAQDPIDIGLSPSALDMPVVQRPGMELLAIYGLETLPIVSFGARVCGFVHDGKLWRFPVEARAGGYYHRWGQVEEVRRQEA